MKLAMDQSDPTTAKLLKEVAELDHLLSCVNVAGDQDAGELIGRLKEAVVATDPRTAHGPPESIRYLQAVRGLSKLVEDLHGDGSTGTDLPVDRAHRVLEMAMGRLEDELVHLLVHYQQPVDPMNLTFLPDQDYSMHQDYSGSSFGEFDESSEFDNTVQSTANGTGEARATITASEFTVDLIQPSALQALHWIAGFMFTSGYDEECTQAYITARRDAMDEFMLHLFQHKQPSIEELVKAKWRPLDLSIRQWNSALRVFIQVYLKSEMRLSELVFGRTCKPAVDMCFYEVSYGAFMQMLGMGQAVAAGSVKAQKLFRILDMYEALNELTPAIESLFSKGSKDKNIIAECQQIQLHLTDSIRRTIAEFKSGIETYVSSAAVPGGGVHPLVKYVMNYIKALTAYCNTLDTLLRDEECQMPTSDHHQIESFGSASDRTGLTRTAMLLQSMVALLEFSLARQSQMYMQDIALQNIFLMNNTCYMVQKAKDSDLRSFLGDKWILDRIRLFQQHAINYERLSWRQVLEFLTEEQGNSIGSVSTINRAAIKSRFRGFNQAFEEVYREQTGWSVQNELLREDIRISISLRVIQAYRAFLGKYQTQLDETRNRDKYVKYSPEDLERLLLHLFEGSQRSL